jgi:hypothetical protein
MKFHRKYWGISDFGAMKSLISTLVRKKLKILKYVCYMMVLDGLPKSKQGYFRLLETNKRVILSTNIYQGNMMCSSH